MPSRLRPLRLRSLLALLVLAASGAVAPEAPAQTATPASAKSGAPSGARKELLADFVEVTSRQSLRRDAALIDLVNMSDITLDVKVGDGATSLKPGERMLAGVQPGKVTVKVIGQDVPTGALEGDLQIEGGRHYELAFAYDVPPLAPEQGPGESGSAIGAPAGSAGAESEPAAPVKAAPAQDGERRKSGKVDIGRKRR